MSLKLQDIVGNIFYTQEKEKKAEEKKSADLQQKVGNVLGVSAKSTNNSYNPFLNKNGEIINPYLNYQKLLNNPNISQKAKNYISQATGLSPTVTDTNTTSQPTRTRSTTTPQNSTFTNQGVETLVNNTSNNSIVNAANKYIGTPYVWGGESMTEGGMDCSGFVYNALKDAGYNIGRTTAQGYRSIGKTVSKANMQPGDLVFFGNSDKATHIGIYIGNGKMIHSSGDSNNTKSNPGKGVSIVNVDYRKDFLEARRY